jgi:hypothetical protein
MTRVVLVVALVAGIAAGCSRSPATPSAAPQVARSTTTTAAAAPTTTSVPAAPEVRERIVAVAKIPQVAVYDAPDVSGARPSHVLRNPTWEGYGLSFLVDESRTDGWLKVNVPVRPNGTTGWIQSADVDLAAVRARVEISLSQHRLRYWNGTSLLLDEPVALGTSRTPTPLGPFVGGVVARPPAPRGA